MLRPSFSPKHASAPLQPHTDVLIDPVNLAPEHGGQRIATMVTYLCVVRAMTPCLPPVAGSQLVSAHHLSSACMHLRGCRPPALLGCCRAAAVSGFSSLRHAAPPRCLPHSSSVGSPPRLFPPASQQRRASRWRDRVPEEYPRQERRREAGACLPCEDRRRSHLCHLCSCYARCARCSVGLARLSPPTARAAGGAAAAPVPPLAAAPPAVLFACRRPPLR